MSRQQLVNLALTRTAVGAVTQYRAVGYDGAQATVQGQKVLGIANWTAASGADFPVNVADTVLVESGAAFAAGDALIVDAQGRAIAASPLGVATGAVAVTSSAANGAILTGAIPPDYIFADALEAATAAGQIVEVLTRH